MRTLVGLCVRHYGTLTALTIIALVLVAGTRMQARSNVFPEFVPSQVDIQTEAPGFAPQQVEELVPPQVEFCGEWRCRDCNDAIRVHTGLVRLTITFNDGIDVHVASKRFGAAVGARWYFARRCRYAETLPSRIQHHDLLQDRTGVRQKADPLHIA